MRARGRGGRSMLGCSAVVAGLALTATPPQAGAATQIGETFPPTGPGGGCSGGFTRLQGVSPNNHYAAPFNGVITTWSYHAPSAPPQLRLKVARPAGGTVYTIVGQSALQMPLASQLNTYGGLRISVQAGDLIGVYLAETGFCGASDQAGYAEHIRNDDSQPGFMGSFDLDLPNSHKLDVSALLEPDCDGDGLGDETQDPDTSSCNPPTAVCQNATVNKIDGTEGDNNLLGTANPDAIFGLGGNDELDGVDGDDCVDGGDGDDRASGGADNDLVKGGDGRDKVRGLGGKDRLKGQGGVDRVNGGEGSDKLSGGPGADKLRGGAAKDAFKGNAGDDDLNAVDAKRDRVNCGAGDDKAVVDPVDRVSANCETVREVEKD